MEPLSTAAVRRPFHWGIVILSAPEVGGEIPDVDAHRAVTGDENAVIVLVRHAQDVESFDDDIQWAEVEVALRLLPVQQPTSEDRREIYRGVLRTRSGRVTVGDADSEVTFPAHPGRTLVVVTVDAGLPVEDHSPETIRIDLAPAE